MKDNIALIGFMGTGKSTVGQRLAERLNMKFLELDTLIEARTGKTIPEIFTQSELEFREIEMQLVKEVSQQTGLVISTGGGIVLNKLNVDYLKQSCDLVLLEAPAKVIFDRIINDGKETRPLLNKPDPLAEIQHLLQFRHPLYEAATPIHINTANKTIEQIVGEILDQLEPESRKVPPSQNTDGLEMQLGDFGEFEGFKQKDTCFICEQPLTPIDPPQLLACSICKRVTLAYQQCGEGHYVCDKCYSGDLAQYLQTLVQSSDLTDPISIANQIFLYPLLKFRGSECAMITATALLLAAMNILKTQENNTAGQSNIPRLIIAIERASILPGDFTAYYGVDNAALGVGIATAVFIEATAKRRDSVKAANHATAGCLEAVQYGTMDPKDAIISALQFGMEYFTEAFSFNWGN